MQLSVWRASKLLPLIKRSVGELNKPPSPKRTLKWSQGTGPCPSWNEHRGLIGEEEEEEEEEEGEEKALASSDKGLYLVQPILVGKAMIT